MRFSIFSLILSQLFFAAAYGQEQPPLQISSDHSSTGSPQSNLKSCSSQRGITTIRINSMATGTDPNIEICSTLINSIFGGK